MLLLLLCCSMRGPRHTRDALGAMRGLVHSRVAAAWVEGIRMPDRMVIFVLVELALVQPPTSPWMILVLLLTLMAT